MLDPGKDCEEIVDGLTPDQIKVIIQEESVKIENGSYTAASPAVTLLAVTSLAAASALMDDPDAARLKLGNLVKEITPGLEEARKSMAHAELMVQKSMEELKGVGDAFGPHLRPRFRDPSWSRLSPYQRLGPDPGLSSQYLAA
ncbi:hypothetical protein D6C78_03340 [Aureobasidium pullulans]|uniref:Uncharacterized protein n=1 Tax=Aureobasidium pullulans TaxID=5580 RepID=A0A4S8ULM9_AURPU|nr:hypothetical protein D6D26_06145 [Aureobasidium pullulans]THW93069.1 hypothetical protein D6D18_06210 [Aureobasidium pullulans]THZ27249.1 hypothetical protein D6C89_03299 [Aureobasidium pullulans]TIA39374.1 hypothetical protein D6C78_03340 [Aureobasidium pullulans]